MASRHTVRILRSLQTASRASRSYASASHATPRKITSKTIVRLTLLGGGLVAFTQAEDLKDMFNRFYLVHADAAAKADPPASDTPGAFRTDTATDTPFPVSLSLTASSPSLTLVGLGVRTVSFLRVKVYSAGFYVDSSTLKDLHNVPGWHTYTASHLLTPPTPSHEPVAAPQFHGEALIASLLDSSTACAVRIVPVRNTDFGHLRDGFTRAIAARQKLAKRDGNLTESDEERIAQSTQTLKSLFPAQSVPKGKALTLLRTSAGALVVEYEGKVLGQVDDTWVSRELMLAYFADKDVISAKLKEDVAKGFESFMKK